MNVIIEFLHDINRIIWELFPIVAFGVALLCIYKLTKK